VERYLRDARVQSTEGETAPMQLEEWIAYLRSDPEAGSGGSRGRSRDVNPNGSVSAPELRREGSASELTVSQKCPNSRGKGRDLRVLTLRDLGPQVPGLIRFLNKLRPPAQSAIPGS
jgi:hypothetical protein